ncbi:MAG: cytochrome c peroxidase [Bdellovibrionota bacterium]
MGTFRLHFGLLGLISLFVASPVSANEPLLPLPNIDTGLDLRKARLGKRLFQDPRLSGNNTVSCASCHVLQRGGSDHKVVSMGVDGTLGEINTPTVFNSGFNFRQFWNGRSKTLEDQIDEPLTNPKEMHSTWDEALPKLRNDPQYASVFATLYPDGLNSRNVKDAIATFERALTTPNSRFDRFLRGDNTILTQNEQLGYQSFKAFGCAACHQGLNVGGNMYQTMGVMGNYFKDRGTPITAADLGRYVVTHDEHDRHVFRVPSLRNVALTAPYFHDGSAATLPKAVATMAKYQLGRTLTREQVAAIVAFLETLTGDTPAILLDRSTEAQNP